MHAWGFISKKHLTCEINVISIYPYSGAHARVKYPFRPLKIKRFSDISYSILNFTWSPIIFRQYTRNQQNFHMATVVGLDFDNKDEVTMPLGNAVDNVFCDLRHIIATTRNHQKPKDGSPPADRFRVILQFERPIYDLRTYRYNVSRLVRHWGSDEAAKDGARLFFPSVEIVSKGDGDLLEVLTPPPSYMNTACKDAELEAFAKLGTLPIWLQRNLHQTVTNGHRNAAVFGMASDLSKIKSDKDFVVSHIKSSQVWKDNLHDQEFINGALRTITGIFERKGYL